MRKEVQKKFLYQRGGTKILALFVIVLLFASGFTWFVFRELEKQLEMQHLSEYLAEVVLAEAINSISIVNQEQIRTRLLADADVRSMLTSEASASGQDIGICLNRLACAAHLRVFTGCYLANGRDQGTFTCTETLACTSGGTRAALVKVVELPNSAWLRTLLRMLGLFESESVAEGFSHLQGTLFMTGPTKSRIGYSNCE